MTIAISSVHIQVDDPDAAVAFYSQGLDFAVTNEVANGGFRWITLANQAQPDISVVLFQPHAGRSQEDGDAVASLLAKGELGSLQFRTDNLDATFEKVAAAPGAEVLEEPTDQPWGVRDAAVRDPAGNLIRIQQA